jgi:hypothetical protein
MMVEHSFGGPWTERKLKCLRDYLRIPLEKPAPRAKLLRVHIGLPKETINY